LSNNEHWVLLQKVWKELTDVRGVIRPSKDQKQKYHNRQNKHDDDNNNYYNKLSVSTNFCFDSTFQRGFSK